MANEEWSVGGVVPAHQWWEEEWWNNRINNRNTREGKYKAGWVFRVSDTEYYVMPRTDGQNWSLDKEHRIGPFPSLDSAKAAFLVLFS